MSSLKKATLIATSTAFMLALLKMTIGVIGNSASVIASAIDSLLDIFISLFNYFAISKSEKAPSKMFNYGLGKIEGFAAVIEGSIIWYLTKIYLFFLPMKFQIR